jgi:hypothetical protein
MSEKPLPFVVNDRRKFTSEGELRPDAEPSTKPSTPTPIAAVPPPAEPEHAAPAEQAAAPAEPELEPTSELEDDPNLPPAPTPEQMEQARLAYTATADRLDVAVRSANPGMEHPPAMSFDQLVQSVYMQAILQLGGGTQQGEQPQVDLLGARQSIDMLAILSDKSRGNLNKPEQRLLDSALFELRLAFLEITQALARSAQQRAANPAGPGAPGNPGAPSGFGGPGRPGPSIVR